MSDAVARNATQFEAGQEVHLIVGSHHAPRSVLNPYIAAEREQLRVGRRAQFVRYMAGGEYAIVHAEPWGNLMPARDLRVLVADIKKIRSA
jgi:hypothetical protein